MARALAGRPQDPWRIHFRCETLRHAPHGERMTPDSLLAACRFAHDAALMALWGASVYLWALVPRGLADQIGSRLNAIRLTAVFLAVVTTIIALPVETAMIG